MKLSVFLFLITLVALPAPAQDQSSCKAYFQVLQGDGGTPGLQAGLDSAQKKWWEGRGQKKYPGLCLNGAITSGDKPRYLVIWSKSKSIGETAPLPADVYGQSAKVLQASAPATPIYQRRWDLASVTILNVLNDGSPLLPPVYFEADDRFSGAFTGAGPINAWHRGSAKVLKAALDYLFRERVFLSKPD